MFFIIWSGFGILVPVVAFLAFGIPAAILGAINPIFASFVGGCASAAALWFLGNYFKKGNHRRHFYFIPMEIWGVIAGAISVVGTIAAIAKLVLG